MSYPALVDARAARIAGGVVTVATLIALATGQGWVLALLAAGFITRVVAGPRFSLLARVSCRLSRAVGEPQLTASSPKRFAQGMGAVMMSAAAILALTGNGSASWVLAGAVAGCALLESALGFCLGCWIYARLMRLGLVHPSVCIDCSRSDATSP